jgi:hypothetical protein
MVAKPKVFGSSNYIRSKFFDLTTMIDLTNNKQIGQMCTLIFRREKGKKKYKQSIIGGNPTIIYLQMSYHGEKVMVAHPVR